MLLNCGINPAVWARVNTHLPAFSISSQLMHTEHFHSDGMVSPLSSTAQFKWNDRMQVVHLKSVSGLQHCQQYKSCLASSKMIEFSYFSKFCTPCLSVRNSEEMIKSLTHLHWNSRHLSQLNDPSFTVLHTLFTILYLHLVWSHKLCDE